MCVEQVNKPAAFAVDLNGVKGKLDARVLAPSGAEEQAVIQELDKSQSDDCYVISYDLVVM